MANTPYEQDSGILSTVLGTATLAGLGYGAYYAINDPVGFERTMTKVFDTVFPMQTSKPDAYQSLTLAGNKIVTKTDALAASRRAASFMQRRSDIEGMLGTLDVHMPQVGVKIKNNVSSVKSYHNWGYKNAKDFDTQVEKFVGRSTLGTASERIQNVIGELTGGLRSSIGFSGTTMNIGVDGKEFNLHLPKWHPKNKSWIAKENGNTMRVHKIAQGIRYGKDSDKNIFIKGIDDPISNVLRILEDPMELLAYANRGVDQGRTSKRIWDVINNKFAEGGNSSTMSYDFAKMSYQEKLGEIKRVAKVLGVSEQYKTELGTRDIKKLLANITREQGQWIAENDKIGMDYFGKQAKVDWWSMVKNGDDAVAIQLRKINSLATKGNELESFFAQVPDAVHGFLNKLPQGHPLRGLYSGAEFGWTTNQTQIAERVMGTIPSVGAFQTAEMFKARARGYEGRFDRVVGKTMFGRVAPIVRNEEAEAYAKNILNKEVQTLGVVGVLDPTISDVTLFRPDIAGGIYSEKAHTYTVNKLATSTNQKKIKTSISAVYDGKTQKYESLQHFLEEVSNDESILDGIQKIKMSGNTTVGVGAGNDLLNNTDSVSIARELAERGNPIRTHTAFEMGPVEISSLVDSWNSYNETGSKIKVSGKLVSASSKASDAVLDSSRYSLGTISTLYGHEIDGAFGDIKIRNYRAEERVKAIVDEMQAKYSSRLSKLGPGVKPDNIGGWVDYLKNELDYLKPLLGTQEMKQGTEKLRYFYWAKQKMTELKTLEAEGAKLGARIGNGGVSVMSNPDARVAFDLFKHVIPVNENGALRAGKGATGYLTFLEYALSGHMGAKDMSFTGEAMQAFGKIANLGGQAFNPIMTAKSLLEDRDFYFNQHIGKEIGKTASYAEHVNTVERLLATVRKHGSGSTIDRLVDTDEAASILGESYEALQKFNPRAVKPEDIARNKKIMGNNAFYIWQQIFPHENEAMTQGRGFNIFRIGLKEQGLFNGIEGTLGYANIFNTIDTSSIYRQGRLLEESLAKSGDYLDLASKGVTILNSKEDFLKLGAEGVMSHVLANDGRNNLRNPEIITQTIFGSNEYMGNGVGIKYDMGKGKVGTAFVGTGAFQGMNQYLGDEDIVTLTETNHASWELIKNAYDRGGVASQEAMERYTKAMVLEHGPGTQGGYKKYGAPHIELAAYSRNLNDHNVLGNKKLLKFLETNGAEAKQFRNMLGHSVYMSEDVYKSTVKKHIEEIQAAFKYKGEDPIKGAIGIFGEDSKISKMLTRGANATEVAEVMAKDSMQLARKVTAFASKIHESGRVTAADINTIKELTSRMRLESTSAFLVRHPILYPGSGSGAFLFAMDQKTIGQGKAIMSGDLLNSLMKADWDGDKIAVMLDLMESNRTAMHTRIQQTQKYSTEVLDMLGQKELLRPAGAWTKAVSEVHTAAGHNADKLAEATERIGKVDTALASYMTKGLTGSADIYTHGIVSDLLSRAKGKLTPEEMEQFGSAVGTFIPWNLVQKSISSKHLERYATEEGATRLERMLSTVGGIDKDAFHTNLRANDGELSLLDIFSLADVSSHSAKNSAWVADGMKHYDTLYKAQFHLANIEEDAFKAALTHIGYDPKVAQANWDARKQALAAMSKEEAAPLVDRVEAFKALDKEFGLMDIISPIRRNVREQQNPITLIRQAFERRRGDKNYSNLDILREAAEGLLVNNLGYKSRAAMERMTGEVGLISGRSLVGVREAVDFAKEHLLNHPARMVGVAGLAMVGMTAINMLFGDATPQSPNDLPSVNNPSFRDNRYNNMLENRQLNNVPNANISSGLLTDSSNSYDSVMNHLQSNFGSHYSSVSVRHDGQDPYKEHMMRYNM